MEGGELLAALLLLSGQRGLQLLDALPAGTALPLPPHPMKKHERDGSRFNIRLDVATVEQRDGRMMGQESSFDVAQCNPPVARAIIPPQARP